MQTEKTSSTWESSARSSLSHCRNHSSLKSDSSLLLLMGWKVWRRRNLYVHTSHSSPQKQQQKCCCATLTKLLIKRHLETVSKMEQWGGTRENLKGVQKAKKGFLLPLIFWQSKRHAAAAVVQILWWMCEPSCGVQSTMRSPFSAEQLAHTSHTKPLSPT